MALETLPGALDADTFKRLNPKLGAKYSPNLWRWLNARSSKLNRHAGVYAAGDRLLIGTPDGDAWFHGADLWSVLRNGVRDNNWAFAAAEHFSAPPVAIADFWQRYAEIGRCAIDPDHTRYWVGDETRWHVEGDTRHCLWCGNHTQRLRRWTEQVERERWEPIARTTGAA